MKTDRYCFTLFTLLSLGVCCTASPSGRAERSETASPTPESKRAVGAFGKEEGEEELIAVGALPPAPVSAGRRVVLEFTFTPRSHVEVPVYPPAFIENLEVFAPLAAPAGKVAVREFTAEEADRERLSYYEGAPPPLRVEVEVPPGTPAGAYPYRGEVNYFYCFETGGICAKRTARVEGVVDVVAHR